jgi:hypothetical protein
MDIQILLSTFYDYYLQVLGYFHVQVDHLLPNLHRGSDVADGSLRLAGADTADAVVTGRLMTGGEGSGDGAETVDDRKEGACAQVHVADGRFAAATPTRQHRRGG